MSTVAAISTAQGAGGISIIRMSGEEALSITAKVFFGKVSVYDMEPSRMYLGRIVSGELVDEALCVYFKAPRSYTGEDLVELHCHGGKLLARRVLSALVDAGAELADRGEFTKRAFLNGKMKLSDAEGIIDMINADSEAALRCASREMTGETARVVGDLQDRLTDVLSAIGGALDYPEELEESVTEDVLPVLREVSSAIDRLIGNGKGLLIKDGVRVAIVGEPNVGKSSLLNRILGKDRAIVTDIAGTTRDVIEDGIEYRGRKFVFYDTAGIRESDDPVERIGISRSVSTAEEADVVLVLTDGNQPDPTFGVFSDKPHILVRTKCDLTETRDADHLCVSSVTGEGVDKLLDEIYSLTEATGEEVTTLRHAEALKSAVASLRSAISSYDALPLDVVAVDVKSAWTALGEITGETANEDIITRIFDNFCVGK